MKPKKEVKPFTPYEILMNYERLLGRKDFNRYFTKEHLAMAEIIKEIKKKLNDMYLIADKDLYINETFNWKKGQIFKSYFYPQFGYDIIYVNGFSFCLTDGYEKYFYEIFVSEK